MVKELRAPVVKGAKDPAFPGCVLVPVRRKMKGFPVANYSVPDTSYFVYHLKKRRVVQILTLSPNGTRLGWDTCSVCLMTVRTCKCKSGVTIPYAIMSIFMQSGGLLPDKPAESPVVAIPFAPRDWYKAEQEDAPAPRTTKQLKPAPKPLKPVKMKKRLR